MVTKAGLNVCISFIFVSYSKHIKLYINSVNVQTVNFSVKFCIEMLFSLLFENEMSN